MHYGYGLSEFAGSRGLCIHLEWMTNKIAWADGATAAGKVHVCVSSQSALSCVALHKHFHYATALMQPLSASYFNIHR